MTPSQPSRGSAADIALERFRSLRAGGILATRTSGELSEADTRAKLIDPILKEVLGWFETDIRREEPIAHGFADYRIGAEFPFFHIEAKRQLPRFDIVVPSRERYLKLTGAHLLGRQDVKPLLEQTAKYAPEFGTEFAVLTNGDQFIVFRTQVRGEGWREGFAFVWHDHDDIEHDFQSFFNMLSADRVRAGSLNQSFDTLPGVTRPRFAPLEFVRNPDGELVRNRFWNKIAKVVGPLLTDDPQDADTQNEIIQHCYVRTEISDQVDKSIDALIRDTPTARLMDANVHDLRPGQYGKTAFEHNIEDDIKIHRPGTYLLTGGVGSGKTTFIRRFERLVGASFVKQWCVWLHVDYLPVGAVEEHAIDAELRHHTYTELRRLLESQYPELWPSTGVQLREVFSTQIQEAKLTLLHGIVPDSPEWLTQVNALVHALFSDPKILVESILNKRARDGRRIVVVLDNTDQLGERFQERVFLLSQQLSRSCAALTVVALREEKFFAAYRRGIFDAYGDRRFHIGSPNLSEVVRKRLEYAITKYSATAGAEANTQAQRDEVAEVEQVIRTLIRSATHRNQNIIRLLACMSNGDMRHALGMFREFISSGNTDIAKILNIVRTDGFYSVPFHEFAKSAILRDRRFYRNNVSHIINLFVRSAAVGASHLTALRMLARLANAAGAPSVHGEGFVDTSQLIGEFRQSFGRADDFVAHGDELLGRDLIESEPPKVGGIQHSDALRISASGMYYYRYLVRAFAYLDLIFVDTAIYDVELAKSLAGLAQAPFDDFQARFDRVRLFLRYIWTEEEKELQQTTARGGPYVEQLVPAISDQIETEIELIKRKKGLDDLV